MSFLQQKKIFPNLISFSEHLTATWNYVMFLVIGDDSAALIDSGVGLLPNLSELVRAHTEKPLSVLFTHSDPDHVGGGLLFDENLLHISAEDASGFEASASMRYRTDCMERAFSKDKERLALSLETLIPTVLKTPHTFTHGQIFDLGGLKLEAFHLPGHTVGSYCFINDRDGFALVGDAITKIPLLSIPRCTSLERYYLALQDFHARTKGMNLYCGHSVFPIRDKTVEYLLAGCEEILSGNLDGDGFDKYLPLPESACKGFRPRIHPYRSIILRYNADKLYIEDEASQPSFSLVLGEKA